MGLALRHRSSLFNAVIDADPVRDQRSENRHDGGDKADDSDVAHIDFLAVLQH